MFLRIHRPELSGTSLYKKGSIHVSLLHFKIRANYMKRKFLPLTRALL
jgi:hypothetical protein